MKEFEKWQYEHKYYMCADGFQSGIKEGWKAALEWALTRTKCGDIEMAEDEIQEELNAKT